MYITLNEDTAALIVESLQSSAAEYRRISERRDYPDHSRTVTRQKSIAFHDLCSEITRQIDSQKSRKDNRTPAQRIDPYDNDWPINDPRKW
jgi:hypothetical protein